MTDTSLSTPKGVASRAGSTPARTTFYVKFNAGMAKCSTCMIRRTPWVFTFRTQHGDEKPFDFKYRACAHCMNEEEKNLIERFYREFMSFGD